MRLTAKDYEKIWGDPEEARRKKLDELQKQYDERTRHRTIEEINKNIRKLKLASKR